MFTARLPSDLVDQIVEAAEEEGEGVSQADIVEQGMREWFDARAAAKAQGRW